MTREWQLQEAQNKLSEVVDEALKHGPQVITRRGVQAAIVLSYEDYRRMVVNQGTLSEFFRASPLADIALDFNMTRTEHPLRDNA
ncbi:MAG: type II toxin-antitoxin system Phd/YefM family antitoxin [Chloroflexaceae bacterium]|nr:type II toxin-antitoxin system Phd/YefM family antitoxin [Chloroflexaceae bacterium]